MSQENVKTVQSMYAAFASGDVPTVLGSMDPKIEWNEAENFPYADGNPYVGPDAIVEGVFARLVGEWEYWHLAVERVLDAGDTARVQKAVAGR
jgi:ketosteroid isomerase-like protein